MTSAPPARWLCLPPVIHHHGALTGPRLWCQIPPHVHLALQCSQIRAVAPCPNQEEAKFPGSSVRSRSIAHSSQVLALQVRAGGTRRDRAPRGGQQHPAGWGCATGASCTRCCGALLGQNWEYHPSAQGCRGLVSRIRQVFNARVSGAQRLKHNFQQQQPD